MSISLVPCQLMSRNISIAKYLIELLRQWPELFMATTSESKLTWIVNCWVRRTIRTAYLLPVMLPCMFYDAIDGIINFISHSIDQMIIVIDPGRRGVYLLVHDRKTWNISTVGNIVVNCRSVANSWSSKIYFYRLISLNFCFNR